MSTNKSKAQIEDENKILQERLDKLEALILNQSTQNSTLKEETFSVKGLEEYEDKFCAEIPPNRYIKVMSLTNNTLVLSTGGMGKGKIFEFSKFGQVKNIVYSEVADIINNQDKFTKQGRYYILNKDVIINHDLEDVYTKLLTKKTIENIMEFDTKQIHDIFYNATEAQRKTIVSILINKLKDKDDVDLNKLNVISKIHGKNIIEIIEARMPDKD